MRIPIRRWADLTPSEKDPPAPWLARSESAVLLGHILQGTSCVLVGCRGVGKRSLLLEAARRLVDEHHSRPEQIGFVDLESPVPRLNPGELAHWLGQLPQGQTLGFKVIFVNGIGWIENSSTVFGPLAHGTLSLVCSWASAPGTAIPGLTPIPCWPLPVTTPGDLSTDLSVDTQSRSALRDALQRGGLPALLTAESPRQRARELVFQSLLLDVLLRQPVRDAARLTDLAVYLISQTGRPISATRLKQTGRIRSVDQARAFLRHLQDAGLISLVTRLEDAQRPAAQSSRLCLAADPGLSQAFSRAEPGQRAGDDSLSCLGLTVAAQWLQRRQEIVHAWRAAGRIGLAVGPARRPERLIDVQLDEAAQGDPRPLRVAMARHGCAAGLLLGWTTRSAHQTPEGEIQRIGLASWLAHPAIQQPVLDLSTDTPVDTPVRAQTIARHLL